MIPDTISAFLCGAMLVEALWLVHDGKLREAVLPAAISAVLAIWVWV